MAGPIAIGTIVAFMIISYAMLATFGAWWD
jgi:hypothetical protein